MRSVLFFDGIAVTWICRTNLAWMPERKPWGEFLICINKKCYYSEENDINLLFDLEHLAAILDFTHNRGDRGTME